MLGTLLVVMAVFVFVREPAIDNMPRRNLGKLTLWEPSGRLSAPILTTQPIQPTSPFARNDAPHIAKNYRKVPNPNGLPSTKV